MNLMASSKEYSKNPNYEITTDYDFYEIVDNMLGWDLFGAKISINQNLWV